MRFALTLFAFALAASTADAQVFPRRAAPQQNCPGGVCPAPSSGFYADPGTAPSANHELHLVGGRLVWVAKAGAAPKVMEASSPDVPADIVKSFGAKSAAQRMHGERAYRIIRAFSERQLVDEAVKKGYKPADARAKARELVGKLTDTNIDDISVKMAGVSEGIGDGVVGDRIDNIIRIIEAIMKLLLLFL